MTFLAKVCGLVRAEDVAYAAEHGADLLGFVVHPPSPRHCGDLSVVSPYLERAVLVMVADSAEPILELARHHGFRRVQPHLPEAQRAAGVKRLREAGLFVLLPWADEADQASIHADLYLWEPSPKATGVAGGSGQGHATVFPPPGEFLLAGGLDASNLRERLATLPPSTHSRFRGVDAASRLEATPGVKDRTKVFDYIQTAHDLECP